MQEMLWIGFYLWYAIEYLCIMLSCKWNKQSDRYHDVSFEEEAHNNDKNLNYCKERKHYAWFKYLKQVVIKVKGEIIMACGGKKSGGKKEKAEKVVND